MHHVSTAGALSQVTITGTALGISLPVAVRKAIEDGERLRAATGTLGTPGGLAEAAVEAIMAGRDPLDDDSVRRAVIAQQLYDINIRDIGERRTAEITSQALRANADAIIGGWSKALAADDETLHVVAPLLPADLDDHRAILASDRGKEWERATSALKRVDAALAGWNALYSVVSGELISTPHLAALRIADLTLDQLDEIDVYTPWALVQLGHHIDLPSVAAWRQRRSAVIQQRQRRADAAAQRDKENLHKLWI